jgi:hypothetical protein
MDMDQVCGLVNSTGRTPVAALSYATAFHQQQRAGGHGCTSCQCFVNVVNDAQVCGSLNVFRGNGFDDIDDGGDAVKALGRDAIDGTPLPFYQNFTSGTRVDLVCRLGPPILMNVLCPGQISQDIRRARPGCASSSADNNHGSLLALKGL